MDDTQLRAELALIRAQIGWTQAALFGALQAVRLSQEDAEGLAASVQAIVALLDHQTADQPGEQQRAERAIEFLGALRAALGLPPG